ncbi:hypothetical protein HK102_010403, partial [Quaeritorhiza haematococci]
MTPQSAADMEQQQQPYKDPSDAKSWDEKRVSLANTNDSDETPTPKPPFGKRPKRDIIIHLGLWLLLTAYAIPFLILGKGKNGYELAIIVYIFISLRLLAQHVSMSQVIYTPLSNVLVRSSVPQGIGRTFKKVVPERFRMLVFGIFVASLLLLTLLLTPIDEQYGNLVSRLQSFAGIFVLLGILFATSADRRAIPWRTVVVGLLLQFLIAIFVLRTQLGISIVRYMSTLITNFLKMSHNGLEFIFGPVKTMNFAISVLPAIVFFCAFINIVYYWGGMQYIVKKFATLMMFLMDTSGAESVVAAASPFVGMGESALLVKPFVEHMTMSELHCTMTSGFATIAGSVLLAYVDLLKDTSSFLTACVMSVPASLAVSKMRYPEKEQSITKGKVRLPEEGEREANFLHAAGNGAATGMQLIILISGSLLAIVSLFSVADFLVGWSFDMINLHDTINGPQKDGSPTPVSIKLILSFVFAPIAFLLGVPLKDCRQAAEFMALKMVVNEFVAYKALSDFIFEDNVGVLAPR